MPPKSVHITNYYHKNSGGISTSFNSLMAAAERHRRDVRLIVPGENESEEWVNEFAKIYYVPAKYSPVFDKRYRLIMPWQYMKPHSIIRRILLDEKPDIVEITDKYTISMFGAMVRRGSFRELNRPLLVHFSCERMDDNISSFLSGGRFGKWLARSVVGNYILPSFDFHLANSGYTSEEFSRSLENRSKWFLNFCWRALRSPRVRIDERIKICPRGVNLERFSPEGKSFEARYAMAERADVPADSVLLLYAGRISPEKNIGLLVEMMKILARSEEHDFRLLVAGAGPQSEWLSEQTQKHFDGKIVQLGHVDRDTLASCYSNADIFVHPNPREPFGIGPLEAMASGAPTLAPNSGGILSYATDENAWLVEPTAEAFASSVKDIVRDQETRERKVANAIATAKKNSREASTDFLFQTYDEIFEEFHRRHAEFTDKKAAENFDFVRLLHA